MVQSRQLHHGSSQSASLPGAVYPTTLYLSPHHANIGSADRLVLPIHLNGKKRKPKSTFELAATGRKLGENLISFTACKYPTYIGKQFRRRRIFFFSRCNLKCSLLRWHYQRRRFLFNPILQTSKGKSSLEGLWRCLSY